MPVLKIARYFTTADKARHFVKASKKAFVITFFLLISFNQTVNAQPVITLGTASEYAAMGRYINLSNCDIYGNVAVGNGSPCSSSPSYNINFMSPGLIHGIAYTQNGVIVKGKSSNASEGVINNDNLVTTAFSDALYAYNRVLTLTPDQTISGNISSSKTITATHGGQYVIRITGNITSQLILNPYPSEVTKFILIVEGTITLGGSDIVGASTSANSKDVLIVIKGTGSQLTSHIGNFINGTMLAPYRGANFHGFNGAMIGGCEKVTFMSDCQIHFVGYEPLSGSIGDRVWIDENNNGLQDAFETMGIEGVALQLKNSSGTVIATTNTNTSGNYLFSGLDAGNYTVVFPSVISSGAVLTTQHEGSDPIVDSDPDPRTGITQVISLATAQNITNIDAGYSGGGVRKGSGVTTGTNSCLGEATSFGLLGLKNGNFTVNSGTNLLGNAGYSKGVVSGTNQKVMNFVGTAYVHSQVENFAYAASTFNPSGGIIRSNSSVDAQLDQANTDAVAASENYASYAADIVLGNVTTNKVVNKTGHITVVSISSLNYNSNTIQLVGQSGQDDAFIINVYGSFDFSQSTVLLTNIRAERVVWNFPNASNITINKSSNIFRGTILAPQGSVIYHNPASFEGAIIAKNIAVHSAFNLTQRSLDIPCQNQGVRRGTGNANSFVSDKPGLFTVKAMSNPSNNDFTLQITGSGAGPIRIRILDLSGRQLSATKFDEKVTLTRLGDNLRAGIYFAEVIQGTNRQVLKLIKQN